ncbi:DUF1732 domain-containing protein [Candidatus Dependentiae bacterium]|nr:DUF1732 domain-containing protein [Candidatus Dependentiae bacterium]
MLHSMTGFSTETISISNLTITCNLKSLNHKYADFEIQIPITDLDLELELLSIAKKSITRGKLSINIEIVKGNIVKDFELDTELLKKVNLLFKKTRKILGDDFKNIPITNLFQFKEIIRPVYRNNKQLRSGILKLFTKTLLKLLISRRSEGNELESDFKMRLKLITSLLKVIKSRRRKHVDRMSRIFNEKLKQYGADLMDPVKGIIKFELSVISEKCDITEELVRCKYHISNFLRSINSKTQASGKKLDFITQELLREINTISSKSSDFEIRNSVISIKDELEKIRQQVRNIE